MSQKEINLAEAWSKATELKTASCLRDIDPQGIMLNSLIGDLNELIEQKHPEARKLLRYITEIQEERSRENFTRQDNIRIYILEILRKYNKIAKHNNLDHIDMDALERVCMRTIKSNPREVDPEFMNWMFGPSV